MKEFLEENMTKVFGYIVSIFSAVGTLAAAGAFIDLMSDASIRWLAIVCGVFATVFGGATVGRGYNNTSRVRVAEAMATAVNATPGDPLPQSVKDYTIVPKPEESKP